MQKTNHWPQIENALAKKGLEYVDVAIAEKLLQDYPEADESVAAFLCHISAAMREGHLCIQVNPNEILPSIEQLGSLEDARTLSSQEIQSFQNLVKRL